MGAKLIVIDGLDSSGKETQCKILKENLIKDSFAAELISFPSYGEDYAAPIKMYLGGEFGMDPNDVNPYAASTFYAVDRFCTYKKTLSGLLEKSDVVVCDRYTSSNAIHQSSKLSGEKRQDYLKWLYEFEYDLLLIPRPDAVLFLDMPPQYAIELMRERRNKITDAVEKDIHEKNEKYLIDCYDAAKNAADYYKWETIGCVCAGKILTVEEISEKIYEKVLSIIK